MSVDAFFAQVDLAIARNKQALAKFTPAQFNAHIDELMKFAPHGVTRATLLKRYKGYHSAAKWTAA